MPKGGNMENAKVFISHSHKDKIIATALVDLLIKLGLEEKYYCQFCGESATPCWIVPP